MRDPLWPVIARRATAAVYRGSSRAGVARRHARELVDATGPLPQPRLEDQIAVSLAHGLPRVIVAALGVRGLRVAARLIALPFRALGLVLRVRGVSR